MEATENTQLVKHNEGVTPRDYQVLYITYFLQLTKLSV